MKKKEKINKFYRYAVIGLIAFSVILFLIVLIMSEKARAAIFISVFIVLNMVIANYKRFISIPIEIETITLGIVLCTVAYGLKAGLIVAILGGILSFLVGFNVSPFSFPMLLGYILVSFTAFILGGVMDVTSVGIISTVIHNALVFTLYYLLFRYDLLKNAGFSISNIFLNSVLFYNIAPVLIKLMV